MTLIVLGPSWRSRVNDGLVSWPSGRAQINPNKAVRIQYADDDTYIQVNRSIPITLPRLKYSLTCTNENTFALFYLRCFGFCNVANVLKQQRGTIAVNSESFTSNALLDAQCWSDVATASSRRFQRQSAQFYQTTHLTDSVKQHRPTVNQPNPLYYIYDPLQTLHQRRNQLPCTVVKSCPVKAGAIVILLRIWCNSATRICSVIGDSAQ